MTITWFTAPLLRELPPNNDCAQSAGRLTTNGALRLFTSPRTKEPLAAWLQHATATTLVQRRNAIIASFLAITVGYGWTELSCIPWYLFHSGYQCDLTVVFTLLQDIMPWGSPVHQAPRAMTWDGRYSGNSGIGHPCLFFFFSAIYKDTWTSHSLLVLKRFHCSSHANRCTLFSFSRSLTHTHTHTHTHMKEKELRAQRVGISHFVL